MAVIPSTTIRPQQHADALAGHPARTHALVVAVDGSPSSVRAVDWVAARARTHRIKVKFVSVAWTLDADPAHESSFAPLYAAVLEQDALRLHAIAPSVATTSTIQYGGVAASLVRAAHDSDLLVVGSDKSKHLEHFVFGNVPLKVVARAGCPVAVIPATTPVPNGPVVLAVGTLDSSVAPAAFAAAEARATGVPLHLVHTWELGPAYPSPIALAASPYDLLESEASTRLHRAATAIRQANPDLEVTEQLTMGPTVPTLLRAAASASVLVIGKPHRSHVEDIVLGSVPHAVLLQPPCPVVVVPTGV